MVGEADGGRQAAKLAETLSTDVVVMDIAMTDMNGIEATRSIRATCPPAQAIALSSHSHARYVSNILGRAPAATSSGPTLLQLLAEGLTSPGIGKKLFVATSTVETHRRTIVRKLNIHSVADLTKYAIREGLTTLDE